jgi:hypothetical protein
MNNKLERTRKKTAGALFELVSLDTGGETGKPQKPQSGYSISLPKFEPGISQTQMSHLWSYRD